MAQTVKHLVTMQETWVQSLGREDLLEKEMATHSVLLPGKSHGRRSLVGYSPWSGKKSRARLNNFTSLGDIAFYYFLLTNYDTMILSE